MTSFLRAFTLFRTDRRAVTALEYGLIAAAVVAVGLAGFSLIGDELHAKVDTVQTALDSN